MSKKSKPQMWIEYAVVRILLGALRVLPMSAAIFVGVSIGRLAYHALGKLRRVGMRNLELAFPEMTEAERAEILKGAFRNLGRVMAVTSWFDGLEPDNVSKLIEYKPDEAFTAKYEETRREGRGRIILGGHIGNWELQAFFYPFFFE